MSRNRLVIKEGLSISRSPLFSSNEVGVAADTNKLRCEFRETLTPKNKVMVKYTAILRKNFCLL